MADQQEEGQARSVRTSTRRATVASRNRAAAAVLRTVAKREQAENRRRAKWAKGEESRLHRAYLLTRKLPGADADSEGPDRTISTESAGGPAGACLDRGWDSPAATSLPDDE